ncbi:MAG: DUF1588 domain-containing protein [Deltaproteobacteria bacterium]|nr:DUF1588 domain-containing protein [Deltaproteobacteria bacterium]
MKFLDGVLKLRIGILSCVAACGGVIPNGYTEDDAPTASGGDRGGEGSAGGASPAPASGGLFTCERGSVAATPKRIWRLSPQQYSNTVETLWGGRDRPTKANVERPSPFDDEPVVDRFSTFSRAHLISDLAFGRVLDSASRVANEYVRYLHAQHRSCPTNDNVCAFAVVQEAAEKLFRRPLQPVEDDQYKKLLTEGRALLGDEQGLALVIESLLLAPSFLYRVELGRDELDDTGRTRLSSYEIASAISYSLTDAPPDEALWKAAQANALSTADDIRAQVQRLASLPAHRNTVMLFLKEYFRHSMAQDVFKDDKQVPFHDAALLIDDTDRWLAEVYEQTGRDQFLKGLLTFDQVVVRGKTAPNYNLEKEIAADAAPKLVRAPDNQRVGMLAQPSFLTALSHSEATDPVRRGRFVAENLLCVDIPELPIGLVPELPEATAESTLRDRLKQHVEDDSCKACHKLMDPIGLGFEGYDHVGRIRATEGGKPVNTQGVLVGADVQEEPFEGVAQLAQKLGDSSLVSQCFVRHGFSYWLGRATEDSDGCALQAVHDAFVKSGQDHVALLTSLFSSEPFLLRRP